MSRLLWFVLGGIATALGAGVAAAMLDGESDGDSDVEAEDGQETIALGGSSETQLEGDG